MHRTCWCVKKKVRYLSSYFTQRNSKQQPNERPVHVMTLLKHVLMLQPEDKRQ